ncbi:MAG: GGDEF domain-containing protein [Pseudomonadota bacterium]
MDKKRFFAHVDRRLKNFPRLAILIAALVATILIGVPDYLIGIDISLSIFYILPVGFATWYAGKNTGILIAFVSAVPLLMEQLKENYLASRPGILFWNLFLHVATMGVIVLLLERLAIHLQNEKDLARTDAVTGILNRRAFLELLEASLALMAREEAGFALAYIDLDDFKGINDRDGHDEGDRVLRLLAHTLQKSVRQSDVVARLGGDEFALLIHGANLQQASAFIEKIRHAIRLAFQMESLPLTCSMGCVTFKGQAHDIHGIIKAADLLMYRVKREGKDGVVVEEYTPSAEHAP